MDMRTGSSKARELAKHEASSSRFDCRSRQLAAPSPPSAGRRQARSAVPSGRTQPEGSSPPPRGSRASSPAHVLSALPIIVPPLTLPAANVTSLIQNHFKSATIVLKKRDEDDVQHEPGVRRHRALFISDLHLGTKACQAEAFLDFIRCHDASANLPDRRHRRLLAHQARHLLAAIAQRRAAKAPAQGAQGNRADPHSRQSR